MRDFADMLFAKIAAEGKAGRVGPGYSRTSIPAKGAIGLKHLMGAVGAPLAPLLYPLARLRVAGAASDLDPKAKGRADQSVARRALRNVANPGSAALHRVVADLHDAGHGNIARELTQAIKDQPGGKQSGLGHLRRLMQAAGAALNIRRGAPAAVSAGITSAVGAGIEQAGSRKHFARGLAQGGKSSIWRRWADPVGASQYDIAASVKKHDPHTAARAHAALHGKPIPGGMRDKMHTVAQALRSLGATAGAKLKGIAEKVRSKVSK